MESFNMIVYGIIHGWEHEGEDVSNNLYIDKALAREAALNKIQDLKLMTHFVDFVEVEENRWEYRDQYIYLKEFTVK